MSMSESDAHRIGIEFVSDRSIGGKCRCRMKAVGTHIESASSLFLIARRVADGGASSFPLV
jgi:hypothetical protein